MDGEGERAAPARPHSRFAIGKGDAVPVVLQWLENNYEQHNDASTPKQDVYQEYSDFCTKHRIEPTSASAFGRLVRLAFPATTSRRLGARGSNVTVYNHFRRRKDSQDTLRPLASPQATLFDQPPSPSSVSSVDGDNPRLRGGGNTKADGRLASMDDLRQGGRMSSIASFARSSIDDDVDNTGEGRYAKASSVFEGADSLLNHDFLSASGNGRSQSTCTMPSSGQASMVFEDYDGLDSLDGGVNSNFLMKMLKSEENGPELYDSLHRILYGRGFTRRDGMDLEESAPPTRRDPVADAGKQLQLYRGTHQLGPSQPDDNNNVRRQAENADSAAPSTASNSQPAQDDDHDLALGSGQEEEEERKPGLWNADTHLHLMKLCETYRDCYIQHLWLLNPLHPAALEDDNIRYIICTDEGAEERSPLSLSIYWILYSGALMAGHIDRAVEFYGKARDHLGQIFDHTDSSISLVLLPMAYHSRFWATTEEDGLSKCSYYLTLAMEICKRIGCLGSSVYISCLQMYAWFCMTDNNSLSYEEKLQEVRRASCYPSVPMSLQATAIPRNARTSVNIPSSHLQMVEKMFGVVGNIMKGIFIFKTTAQPSNSDHRQPPPSQSYIQNMPPFYVPAASSPHKRKQTEANLETSTPNQASQASSEYHVRQRRRSEDGPGEAVPRAVSMRDESDRQQQQQHQGSQPQQQPRHDYEGYQAQQLQQQQQQPVYHSMFRPNSTLQPLLLPLETMEQDVELLMKSNNPLPSNIYMMFKLWILGERAECLWCMGRPREALQVALRFLEVAKRSTNNFISHYVSIQPILEMVLNIFLNTFRFDEFRELLDAIVEPLNPNIPHVARSKARYFAILFASNPAFSSSAEIDASLSISGSGSGPPIAMNGSGSSLNGSRSGRPGNLSSSEESPLLYGSNDSSDEAGDQMSGPSRPS